GERATLCSHRSSVQMVHSRNMSPAASYPGSLECQWQHQKHQQPVQHHIVSVSHEKVYKMPKSFSQLIADWPIAVLGLCITVVLIFSLAAVLVGDLPDFSDPLSGFEPRGTEVGRKLLAWNNLQKHTGYKKILSLYPSTSPSSFGYDDITRTGDGNTAQRDAEPRTKRMLGQDFSKGGFFCGPPGQSYSRLVFMSENAGSLWNVSAIQSMCLMEQSRIRSHPDFVDLCQRNNANDCCPSWSLGNYIALLRNKSSCLELTERDISHTLQRLRKCALYYYNGSLVPSCKESKNGNEKHPPCATIPEGCTQFDAVYEVLHYMVDKDFLSPQTTDYQVPSLKYSLMFLPVEKGKPMMGIYLSKLENWEISDEVTSITGIDFGIKQDVFRHYLVLDTVYPVLAMLAVLLSMGFYLRSAFITFMIISAIFSSLMVSYFFYKVAFRFTYFPFINLMAIVILTGSCANNAFIFLDLWNLNKSQKPLVCLPQRVSQTLHHFGYLMLGSSFTTSAGFYASYMSNITAIRCFAIYMGTSMLVNCLFMVTWLPLSVVIEERYLATTCSFYPQDYWDNNGHKRYLLSLHHKLRGIKKTLSETSVLLFEKILPCGVIKFRYIWVCWFAALAVGGAYISCVDPKMQLPTLEMPAVQVFRSSHPFERYDSEYSHQFMFERLEHGEDQRMPITLVWGIMPVDNGDHLNPNSNGTLMLDSDFNVSNPDAQRWLLEFCHSIRNQTFYYPTDKYEQSVCFIEAFRRWMESRQCSEKDHALNLCCSHLFPYRNDIFDHCVKMMVMEQTNDDTTAQDLGPRFDAEGRLVALVLKFRTAFHYSLNYTKTKHFYNKINSWITQEIKAAPSGLHNGWFISNLSLYNLQHSLNTETLVATGLSIAVSFVMLLLTTWNVLLSMYAITAIGGTVFVTMGLLVLLEWQLNAVESLFVSAATGLSVEFTMNYCIAYHLCPHSDRLSRVAFSLKQTSGATAMVASAFFSAGVIMLPATVLAYRHLGVFILMVKCISCGFATFFFHSLCCFFGPEKNCGQILWPCTSGQKDFSNHCRPNGAFTCRGDEKHHRMRQSQASNTENEQYELQPLARHLSDSFDNSTCTSKLSNRPSVLSEEMQIQGNRCSFDGCHYQLKGNTDGLTEKNLSYEVASCGCPALQTSSPYKQNNLRSPSVKDANLNSNKAHCLKESVQQRNSIEPRNAATSKVGTYEFHRGLYSSSSSFDVLNDSNETCLSDFDPSTRLGESTSSLPEIAVGLDQDDERGHFNGKRENLTLALKEMVFDISQTSLQQSSSAWKNKASLENEDPVVLPNSKPNLPDVWIKRTNEQEPSN
uniref:Dispatched RND transporter family member 2 n=1 Tax=Latimeria chalumnae TaxID=7897 RepID=H3BE42_LATCH